MIPTSEYLVLSAFLFGVGLLGVIIRRNLLIVMMSIELMLNAVNVAFIAFARAWGQSAGQTIAFFVIALAAAEAAVGLAIVVGVFRTRRTVNSDEVNLMKN
jgi:NADH-quinone oxidoreductase subunit K